jgi:hypothetical protein
MTEDSPQRTDRIKAATGARLLTNETVAKMAAVGVPTVRGCGMAIPCVGYMTLKRVVEALGLTVAEVTRTKAG